MNILVIGDIIGKPGRDAVQELLPNLRREFKVDMVIGNAENTTHGRGITLHNAEELLNAGVDVLTSGNHIWDQKEILPHLDNPDFPLIRPINYPDGVPGRGSYLYNEVLVVNVMGRTWMADVNDPFRAMDQLLESLTSRPKVILVDFHAEATSEKNAMGWYLDGRVSAMWGTHTHVPTADLRILPQGTGYVTDIGMSGPINSIIGNEIEAVMRRFLTQLPGPLPVANGPAVLNTVLFTIDEGRGQTTCLERITRGWE